MRARVTGLLALSAGVIGAAAWILAPWPAPGAITLSRETTYITEPLRDDGTPDYALFFNRRYGAGVTPANNAAVLLLGWQLSARPPDVVEALGIDTARPPLPLQFPTEPPRNGGKRFSEEKQRARRAPWTDAREPLVAAWLEAGREPLARIAEIVRTRSRYFVPMARDTRMDSATHSLSVMRHIGEGLRVRALRSVALGEHDLAVRDCSTTLRLASLLDQGAWFDRLVAKVVLDEAAETTVMLANPPRHRRSAVALLEELERLPARAPHQDALDGQRILELASHMDLYRAARRSPSAWNGRIREIGATMRVMALGLGANSWRWSWELVPPWAVDWDELLRTITRCQVSSACKPELKAAHDDLRTARLLGLVAMARIDSSSRRRIARALLTDDLGWSISDMDVRNTWLQIWSEGNALLQVARVSAALALRRLDTGRYPVDVNALNVGLHRLVFDPSETRDGYAFRYGVSADGGSFGYAVTPLGPTGLRAFCADGAGRFAQTSDGSAIAIVNGLCDPAAQTRIARR